MKVFRISDGVMCAKKDHKVPNSYYNLKMMLLSLIHKNVEMGACGVS